jgi:hypothetical protein
MRQRGLPSRSVRVGRETLFGAAFPVEDWDMLEVSAMPALGLLAVPTRLCWALPPPVPLAAMPYPASFDWEAAAAAGFRTVVCLTTEAVYDPAPLRSAAFGLEDLFHGGPPADPDGEFHRVDRAVAAVRSSLRDREGVIVHCEGGTGRSGTVIGATLVVLGEDPVAVAAWLNGVHRARGRAGWPESPWQRDVLDRFEGVS